MFRVDSIRCVTASMIGCVFALGCGSAADESAKTDSPAGAIDYAASAPPGGSLSQGLAPAAPEFGEVAGDKMLARVDVSDTHNVTFWQVANGRVFVIESYNADKNPGPKLTDFHASKDSYADAYASLAGQAAQPTALADLRAADDLRVKVQSLRATAPRASVPKEAKLQTVATETPSLVMTDGLVFKGVQEDWTWFQGICNQRNNYFSGEDWTHCYGASLTPGNWTVTHNTHSFDEANIMIFDADSSQNATLNVTGVFCGFLGLGLCSQLVAHSVVTPPRYTNYIYAEADDGFLTTATGRSFAVHYVYWD